MTKIDWLHHEKTTTAEAIYALQAQELSKNSTKLDKENGDLQPTCNKLATDCISRQAALDALIALTVYSNKRDLVKEADNHPNTWIEGVAECIDEIEDLPSAQPDTYEALRILDAINSSGRLDYGDYCDLHDAISEIGGAQNG